MHKFYLLNASRLLQLAECCACVCLQRQTSRTQWMD